MIEKRTCGDCGVCCVLMSVPELEKDQGTRCKNLCASGCSVYSTRPQSCRDFECLWLQGALPEWAKPDNIGLMFTATLPDGDFAKATGLQAMVAWEVWSGALEDPRVKNLLADLARRALVVIISGRSRKVIGPRDQLGLANNFIKSRIEDPEVRA